MRILKYLSFVFLGITSFLSANEKGIELSWETVSIENVLSSYKYKELECFDPGHHKTIIRLEKDPYDREFAFNITRPLLAKGKDKQTINVSRDQLVYNSRLIGEKIPSITFSSRGYLPGEKIAVVVSTKHGRLRSKTISFVPNPIVKEDQISGTKISAELVKVSPTNYKMRMEGFKAGEKLQFVSVSGGEKIEHEMENTADNMFYYSPGVIGVEGGMSNVSFVRESGEKYNLDMPWGKEFIYHLEGERRPIVANFPSIKPNKV